MWRYFLWQLLSASVCLCVYVWVSVCVLLRSWCRIIYRTEIPFSIQGIRIHTHTHTHTYTHTHTHTHTHTQTHARRHGWPWENFIMIPQNMQMNIHGFGGCVCGVGVIWVKERARQRETDRASTNEHLCSKNDSLCWKNCGKLIRNCDWPRTCLCMYRCIIYAVSHWVYYEPTLISVEYCERGNTKENKSLWEDRGGRARRRGSRGLLLELKK